MFFSYLKIAVRNLARNKVFSLINIAGLSLGLTCCMLIVLYTKDEISFDRFHANKDKLYRIQVQITDERESRTIGSTNAIHGPAFKAEIPEIREVVRTQGNRFVARKGTALINENVLFADSNFFQVFSMPLLAGNPGSVLSDMHSIVLSEDLAQKYFNTTNAVGRQFELKLGDEFELFTVSGVAKRSPQNSSIQFDAIIPFHYQETRGWTDKEWLGFYMNTFLLLHEKADFRTVVPKMNRVFTEKSADEISRIRDFSQKIVFGLQPFLDIHLESGAGDARNGLDHGSSPVYSYILSGIAIFILLIACINFVNLTVARSLNRAREIGVRKVVGGLRKQLIFQFLGESFMLAFLAFFLALLFTQMALPTFNELANKQLTLSYLLDSGLISGYIVLFLLTGLAAGVYPALVLSGFSPVETLYNRTRLAQKNYLSRGLVVFQFALSVSLVIGTIVIYSQFRYLTGKDLGYNDKNLLRFSVGHGRDTDKNIRLIRDELAGMSGISSVAMFNGSYNGTLAEIGAQKIGFGYISIDDHFLKTLQIPVVKGRNFSRAFSTDPDQAVIVNEAFVKKAGWKDPIGQDIFFGWKNKKMKVVGVIRDYHYASLKDTIQPLLMTQDPNYGLSTIFAKVNPNDIPATIRAVESVFKKYVRWMPFQYDFEDVLNLKRYEAEDKWKQMITLAAALSIFVSCIGLFGLATFNAESRVKEIGIRKVMGASVVRITALLSLDFVRLVLVALVIAFPLSYFGAQRWLSNFPYRITVSWWFFALAGLLAVSIAFVTVGYQSIKAALTDPVKSLRTE